MVYWVELLEAWVYNHRGAAAENGWGSEELIVISNYSTGHEAEFRVIKRIRRNLTFTRRLFIIHGRSTEFVGTALKVWMF